MTAPTLAVIQAAVSEAVDDALATACYQANDDHHGGDCECPTSGVQLLIESTAITATLQALQPFVDECLNYARMNDEVGDRRDADGSHGAAQRAYGSRDAHRAVAKQLQALIGAAGEKS